MILFTIFEPFCHSLINISWKLKSCFNKMAKAVSIGSVCSNVCPPHTLLLYCFLFSPPHLGLDGQRPLPQPAQEVQRGQHGAQLAKVSQLELISECGGRDARQRAQAWQGARRQRGVRYLSRHHVRPGHRRRCGEGKEEEREGSGQEGQNRQRDSMLHFKPIQGKRRSFCCL